MPLFFAYVGVFDYVRFALLLQLRRGTLVYTLYSIYWNMLQLIMFTSIFFAEIHNLFIRSIYVKPF